jgi:methionyl-tRNA formyltransferase
MWDGYVGHEIYTWLINNFPNDIAAIVTTKNNSFIETNFPKSIPRFVFTSEEVLIQDLHDLGPLDLGLLAWWPKLISNKVINLTRLGFINTHPSFLPFGRGKDPSFWAIVDQTPFGVSLHFVNEFVDSGEVIFQKEIIFNWEDTGETLYLKAQKSMIELFKESYNSIRSGHYVKFKQEIGTHPIKKRSDLIESYSINLDQRYVARDLINLLRAKDFTGKPSCFFIDNGVYEIRIQIMRTLD